MVLFSAEKQALTKKPPAGLGLRRREKVTIMNDSSLIPPFGDINKPKVANQTVGHFAGLIDALASDLTIGQISLFRYGKPPGRWHQFHGLDAVEQLLPVTSINRAKKGDRVTGVIERRNQPPPGALHAKNLHKNLLETTCEGKQ